MPNYAIYDPASTPVANLVTQLLKSFDEGKESTLPAARIKNPTMTGVDVQQPMKWSGTGIVIVNLTQAEKDSMKAAQDAAFLTAVKQQAKGIFLNPDTPEDYAISLGFESLATVMKDQVNAIRANFTPAMPNVTMGQISDAFKTIYETKVDNITLP